MPEAGFGWSRALPNTVKGVFERRPVRAARIFRSSPFPTPTPTRVIVDEWKMLDSLPCLKRPRMKSGPLADISLQDRADLIKDALPGPIAI